MARSSSIIHQQPRKTPSIQVSTPLIPPYRPRAVTPPTVDKTNYLALSHVISTAQPCARECIVFLRCPSSQCFLIQITGATGFIGAMVLDELLKSNYNVRA